MFKKQRPKEEEEVIPEGYKKVICSVCKEELIIEERLTIFECFGDGIQHSFTENPMLSHIFPIPKRIEEFPVIVGLYPPIALQ